MIFTNNINDYRRNLQICSFLVYYRFIGSHTFKGKVKRLTVTGAETWKKGEGQGGEDEPAGGGERKGDAGR